MKVSLTFTSENNPKLMKHIYSLILTFISLAAFATNHNVSVTYLFTPSTLSINQGDTVTWTQASGTHNVNGNQSTFPGNPASFGSGSVAGGVWTYSYVFLSPGVYNYHCDPHSSFMTGSITVSSTPCSNLFFSEYGEGSSNHKYIEVYNPSASAISLTGYTVYQSGNGGSYTNSFTTNATIASGDVYLISTNSADTSILAVADTALAYPSIAHFNGNDALILYNGTDTVDVIGVPGVDPGSSWAVGTGSTLNHTLVRKDSVNGGSTNWTTGAMQWDVYAQNTWTYIGSHSGNCTASNVFDTIVVFDTTYIDVFDTIAVFDTIYIDVFDSIAVFDTTYIDVFDTIAVFDTTYIDVFDTIAVFDTTYIDVFDSIAVFDTTYIDVFDTLYITQIDTVTITVMDTLIIDISLIGTNPPMFAYQLLVYPNPTRDFIVIDIPASLQLLGYSIEIVNALGQSIFVSTLNQNQLQVNLNTIGATGTYNLVVKDSTGIIVDTRVIILQ
jgi:plastocyanin